jgi:site-specific recombinase XerC
VYSVTSVQKETRFDHHSRLPRRIRRRLAAQPLRLPGGEAAPLRLEPHRRVLLAYAAGLLRTPRQDADQVTSQDVFAWGYGVGLSGKDPSSITIGARIACLSSFYRFLIRMKVANTNPCDAIERPRMPESTPRGLSAEGIQRLLACLPKTPVGLRDRAIILTPTFTGRRRAEVLGMMAGSISLEGRTIFYTYRGKGGQAGKWELPRPAFGATAAFFVDVTRGSLPPAEYTRIRLLASAKYRRKNSHSSAFSPPEATLQRL